MRTALAEKEAGQPTDSWSAGETEHESHRLVRRVATFCWFLAVTAYSTWPLSAHMATRVPDNLADPLEISWIFGWAAHAIIHHPLHLFSGNIFSPEQYTLAFTENTLGLSLPTAPIFWLTHNAVLQLNVATLVAGAVAGFGLYLLVLELSGSRWAALVAGTAYALLPYRGAQIAHPHVTMHLVPFVLLLLVRIGRRATWRRVVALALVLALQFWSAFTGGLVASFAVLTWGIWYLARHRRAAWPALWRAGVGVLAAAVLTVPVVIPYFIARDQHPEFTHHDTEITLYSATPQSYLSPPGLSGPVVRPVYSAMRDQFRDDAGWWEKSLWPGFWGAAGFMAAVAAAGVAWARRRRGEVGATWLAPFSLMVGLAAMGFVMSLGPHAGAKPGGAPLPFALVERVVPGGLMRAPARFGMLTGMAVAGAAGIALARARSQLRALLVGASLVVLLIEGMPASLTAVSAPRITAAHRSLAGGHGVVLALPTGQPSPDGPVDPATVLKEPRHMYLSTANFRPLVNGYAAFYPVSYSKLVAAVQDFPSSASIRAVRARGVTTVVVQTRLLRRTPWRDVVARLDAWPGVRLQAQDPGVRVYDITGAATP